MRRSYKFRIYPTKVQLERLDNSLDLLRDFYNAALQERRDAWRLNRIRITCFDQIRQAPEIRNITNPEYKAVQAQTLNQTLRKLDKAFQGFFRRVKAGRSPGFPRFKGKGFFNSIIYNGEGYRFRGNKLNLSLIGDLKIKLSRPIEGTIKEVIAKREGSKWYVVLSCDSVPEHLLEPTGKNVGLDVGIESFATLSDGTQIDNSRYYESAQKKLRVAVRRVARRAKGSNRRRKAVAILRSVHQKTFNQRHDFQHKISTDLIANNDLIAVEKLNILGMSKGILSKQIHDASWSSFFHMLRYKAESAGRKLVEVDPRGTSQRCTCGETVKKGLSVRWHHCSKCGLSNHRDIVSAQIILSLGLSGQDLTYRATESVS
jgi:putative transposase